MTPYCPECKLPLDRTDEGLLHCITRDCRAFGAPVVQPDMNAETHFAELLAHNAQMKRALAYIRDRAEPMPDWDDGWQDAALESIRARAIDAMKPGGW